MENNSQPPKRRGRPAGSKNKRTREAVTNPSENMEGDGTDTGMGTGMGKVTVTGTNTGTSMATDMGMGMGMGTGMGLELKMIEVAPGCDVIAAVHDFTNRHQMGGVSVISTHGTVRNVTIYQPNMPSSTYLTYNSVYKLLYLKGNFYGSSSSIRPPPPFGTRHVASFVSGEGLFVGIVHGKLTAASNVFLGVSVINGTESIKLPLPLPRALPSPQVFFDLNGGIRFTTVGLPEFSSGAGRSRTAYGIPTTPSPSPSISWNLMTNNFSSASGSKDPDRSVVRGSLG